MASPMVIRTGEAAKGGIDDAKGAKKRANKKQTPPVIAVIPVLPPAEIPAPDSR